MEPVDQDILGRQTAPAETPFNYSYVETAARIAIYDDLKAAPRVIEIQPNTTAEYIEDLASTIYSQSQLKGGSIPYTAIREVTENFIHAQFTEIVVSILDSGKTIRFADQGPGIKNKEKAQLPGFSSAVEPMKKYIRGVGSGLPIVKEYLSFSQGTITIEDNLSAGAVVTLSVVEKDKGIQEAMSEPEIPIQSLINLSEREKDFLLLFAEHGALGVTDLVTLSGVAQSSTHSVLKKLEGKKLIKQGGDRKRSLTKQGAEVASSL